MPQIYDRWRTVPIEVVLPLISSATKPPNEDRVTLEGVKTHVNGLRLFTFKTKGLTCVSCGVTGSFFALERDMKNNVPAISPEAISPYHLNLYATKEVEGKAVEILMTHDHILARSLGGRDCIDNTQTMCAPCNSFKSVGEHEEVRARRESKILEIRTEAQVAQIMRKIEKTDKDLEAKHAFKEANGLPISGTMKRNAKRNIRRKNMLAKVLASKLSVVQST